MADVYGGSTSTGINCIECEEIDTLDLSKRVSVFWGSAIEGVIGDILMEDIAVEVLANWALSGISSFGKKCFV